MRYSQAEMISNGRLRRSEEFTHADEASLFNRGQQSSIERWSKSIRRNSYGIEAYLGAIS